MEEGTSTARAVAVSIGLVEAILVIWIARPRIGGVVDNRANGSRIFSAAGSTASEAADSAVTVSGVEDLAVFAAAGDDDN